MSRTWSLGWWCRGSARREPPSNLPGSCWNPVTNLILFSLESDAPDWPYSAHPDGTGLRRLVNLPGKIAIEPSFSPDGERIAFEVSTYDAEGNGSIYAANVDGTGIRRLTRGHDDRQPNWSPKGDRIVFQRRKGEVWDVWTIRPNGSGVRNVTKTRRISETDIAWAPDGKRLVFSTRGCTASTRPASDPVSASALQPKQGRLRLTHDADFRRGPHP